ncbi:MAG: acyltransferase [Lachnospiraceae bacterium]|nr:acyltransferase [Lachnospiraceae bacterium]
MKIALHKYLWAARTILRKFSFGKIGKQTYMGPPIGLIGAKNIFLGDRVRIQPGCRLETFDGGKIIIGNGVSIGQNFHCTSSGILLIGDNTTILGNTFITNIDHDYTEIGKHILEQKRMVKETTIGDNCFIGYGAAIQAGTVLGKQCVVGANAVVRGEFPDYCVIVGVPGRVVKRYNLKTNTWEKVAH